MNDFLQQFLIESRELVEQASDGLARLEHASGDAEELDAVFRSFHTLKGGAGIVEFAAMERAVHAAEDVLTEARSGKRVLTPALIGDCLACLDQVAEWLGSLEDTGELPSAGVAAAAERIIRRFDTARAETRVTIARAHDSAKSDWLTAALDRARRSGEASTAVRFVPDPECFFQGEDPIARMSSLPQLLALDLEPVQRWPALASLDPLTCNLALTGLTASSVGHVEAHMAGACGQSEIIALVPELAATVGKQLPPHVREMLEAQRALIANGKPEALAGRLGSAGLTATNVLRFSGLLEQADAIARATQQSLAEQLSGPLHDAIDQTLAAHTPVLLGADEPRPRAANEPTPRAIAAPRTLRVDAQRIDTLVRLTGELTVAKNSLHHLSKLARADGNSLTGALKDCHGVFEHLVGELQRSVLAMRVLPLRSVFQRFPRVLREMSANLGKPARLQTEGEDTEADRAIVEMLFEPLLHVVRNALDHGIESAAERAARGKPAVATIRIKAARQADQVHINVSDDGGGIDVERVRRIAKDRGVTGEEQLRSMTNADLTELLFAAGFSTAEKVTELSGRGVGLDAVRAAVERSGGRVSIESRSGEGTTVKFSVPFSAMMTRVLTVEAGGQMYGIPLDSVVETVRVPTSAIARIGAAEAIVLKGRTIPILDLAGLLGATPQPKEAAEAIIVVATFAGQYGGIRVDRLGESLEAMLKPCDGLLLGTPGITGTTLTGDGRVLLVLDIAELLQ